MRKAKDESCSLPALARECRQEENVSLKAAHMQRLSLYSSHSHGKGRSLAWDGQPGSRVSSQSFSGTENHSNSKTTTPRKTQALAEREKYEGATVVSAKHWDNPDSCSLGSSLAYGHVLWLCWHFTTLFKSSYMQRWRELQDIIKVSNWLTLSSYKMILS